MADSLRRRLLADIAELQTNPYPNIQLHVDENDFTNACLILTTERYGLMHMTVQIPAKFPIKPPAIRMDSDVAHPNIYGSYICASILNTTEGYTSAYTLKGIAIQLLSFFSSDSIEQTTGGTVSLDSYQKEGGRYGTFSEEIWSPHVCNKCRFGKSHSESDTTKTTAHPTESVLGKRSHSEYIKSNLKVLQEADDIDMFVEVSKVESAPKAKRLLAYIPDALLSTLANRTKTRSVEEPKAKPVTKALSAIQKVGLPNEVLILVCDNLETENMMAFAQAWSRIGRLVVSEDLIRTRELQCFCFKNSYRSTKLGVGVAVTRRGRMGSLGSEFDLLSHEAFKGHHIRNSVQGIPFEHWLPLPISWGHWRKVGSLVPASLIAISTAANLETSSEEKVLYHFMSDVVVKLNEAQSGSNPVFEDPFNHRIKSTLTHASEKAIESFFHIFHLLLCLATERRDIVIYANKLLLNFINGETSKDACPNLGHLLVAALISEIDMDDNVIKAIIKEAVTRNVVWMLDAKGSNMPELAYMEPSAVSEYRLKKTFEASKISYRLLMFLRLFQSVAVGNPRKPLMQLRDEAFARHGAPPRGSAKDLADSIKRIHQVNSFPDFLLNMGLKVLPSKANFTSFLRDCVQASITKGYSKMPYTQGQALALRRMREPNVEIPEEFPWTDCDLRPPTHNVSFFPGKPIQGGHWSDRGGRGRGRGRGH